jgi:K+/H+ antiporter YhaU regulatory subunit KhtT
MKTISPIELSNKLGVSKQTVYSKIRAKKYKTVKQNKRIRILLNEDNEPIMNESVKSSTNENRSQVNSLLKAKDEQIEILKQQIEDLKQDKVRLMNRNESMFDALEQMVSSAPKQLPAPKKRFRWPWGKKK